MALTTRTRGLSAALRSTVTKPISNQDIQELIYRCLYVAQAQGDEQLWSRLHKLADILDYIYSTYGEADGTSSDPAPF